MSWPGGVERQFGVSLSGRGAVRAIPLRRRRMSLQVTFGIEPVQNKTGREGEDQNQYQRVDAHTHAPVPLQVRDIRTENAPRNVTGAKYLPRVAKISQMARAQFGADRVARRPLQV